MQSSSAPPSNQYSRAKRRMVDSHVQRSLNLLHINKCNQVDILSDASCFSSSTLSGDDLPKEEYMGTSGIPVQVDELFTDCVVAYAGHSDDLLQQLDVAALNPTSALVDDEAVTPEETFDRIDQLLSDQHKEALDHLTRICRCCLSVRKNLQSLFENENCISDMIMAIASIQLSPTDKMPSQICMSCVLQLSRALSFKQQLETADVTLRHYIDQGYLNGMKLVSLESSDLEDDPVIINSPELEATIDPPSDGPSCIETERTIVNSSDLIAIGSGLSETILLDPILSDPVADLADEKQLLQPLQSQGPQSSSNASQSYVIASEHITKYVSGEVPDEGNVCAPSTPDDDGLNTLLQPLETHQLPRTEPETDSYEDENEPDADYIDEDIEMDDDEVSNADASKLEMDGAIASANSSLCGDIVEVEIFEEDQHSGEVYIQGPNDVSAISGEDHTKGTFVRKITSWACFVCKKSFKDLRELQQHNQEHYEDRPFQCATCDKQFLDRADMEQHSKCHVTVLKTITYSCTDCWQTFTVERDLRIHRSVHRADGKFVCAECEKEVSTLAQLKRHIRTHFEDKPHKCAVCEMAFSERGSLTRHFRKHTNDVREKKHECKLCDKKYSDAHSLLVHTRKHTGERPWVCTDCGKAFIDSRLLNSHRKVHSTEKPYACTLCDRRFTHQSTLTTHVRLHTGEKPFVCTVCGKSFIQSSNLVLHMRVHSGEKPYQCGVCHMRFSSSSTLTVHGRIHTGEKPYDCKICNKKFARQDISTHMRTHTGERPFACNTCPSRFATSSQLVYHTRSHTGERPYACNVCDKSFAYRSFLKKHLLDHINGDPKKVAATTTTVTSKDILNNPSTLQAINEMARASTKDNNKIIFPTLLESNHVGKDRSKDAQVHQTTKTNSFRIEKVHSVGQGIVISSENETKTKRSVHIS